MQLYLHQNDEATGPFEAVDVRDLLRDGVLSPDVLAWHEGATDWRPVGELLQIPLPPPLVPPGSVPAPVPASARGSIATPAQPAAPSGSFFARVPAAFRYPLKGDGPLLLLGATGLFTLVHYLQRFPTIFALIIGIGGAGYFIACLQGVLVSSAQGEAEMPGWPEVSDLTADLLGPFGRFVGLLVLTIGPGFLVLWAGNAEENHAWTRAGTALMIAGSFYLPMALLAVAMTDNLLAASPMVVLPAIARLFAQYFTTWMFLALVLLLQGGLVTAIERLIPVPLLPVVLGLGISLYLLTVQMRLLGLLYFVNRDRLNWV